MDAGHFVELAWEPLFRDGAPRRLRRRGTYRAFVPTPLRGRPSPVTGPLAAVIADTVADVRDAVAAVELSGLGVLADVFVRSEVTASSHIEGYHASARKLALAEFTGYGRPDALTVVRNLHVLRQAMSQMTGAERIELDDLVRLQSHLVPRQPGVREDAVWIGGDSPLDASYVAPPHLEVDRLLQDLLWYVHASPDDPVTTVATAHAAFETIHPFLDGNGRIGRVLANVMLARLGLGGHAVLPLSVILGRRRREYFDLLDAYRDTTRDRRGEWIQFFASALSQAAVLARDVSADAEALQEQNVRLVVASRHGRPPRVDSATRRLLDGLFDHPVDTAASAARRLGVSTVAARAGLEELAGAGVLRRQRVDRGKSIAYTADDVLGLVGEEFFVG